MAVIVQRKPAGGSVPDEIAVRAAALLMPLVGSTVNTPQGTGRLLQVFRDQSTVVLDRDPRKATTFPTKDLARLQRRAEMPP